MSLNYDHILVLDLETTGTDENEDVILEIAGVLVTTDLRSLQRRSSTVAYPQSILNRMDPYVIKMHTDNGLLAALANADFMGIHHADDSWCEWLKWMTGSSKHVALAGSGVGHFDRRFIKRHMPNLDKRLTYWPFDVGVVRRIASDLAGIPADLLPDQKSKTHRAIVDAEFHLEELRFWTGVLKSSLRETN